ncbi:M48 family metalloprotease [Nocardia terpenica]|uniref:M48 family metalloprotease n=1 Tax=Nocardia terpenica TaxID=455432 RepID=A0A6G9YXK6_9NOCA|nr:M48 family metalloprotease [Nocardia terpenica]QIS18089.1 M48 family metalloprotease [Nocardia terpenica]
MSAALGLFVFATVVAVCAPRVLPRLTRHGVAPRLGVAAWSTLIVSALGCWAVAAGLALADATHSWLRPEQLMAEGLHEAEVIATGHAGLAAELALVAVTAALVAGIAVLGVRLARLLRRMRLRSRDHAEALRLTGRRVHRHDVGEVVVVDTPERAAYCVAGEPNVVVVTSAALAALEDRELAAVLAHEHAHLARRHPLLLAVTRGLAATFPGCGCAPSAPARSRACWRCPPTMPPSAPTAGSRCCRACSPCRARSPRMPWAPAEPTSWPAPSAWPPPTPARTTAPARAC